MNRLTIEIDGEKEILEALGLIADNVKDMRPIWKAIVPYFYQIERKLFQSEGDTGAHGRWKPLSPKYAEHKIKKWGHRPIMVASEVLRTSLVKHTSTSIVQVSPKQLTIGTRVKSLKGVAYPAMHQRGYGRLPKRRVIDPTKRQKRSMFQLAIDHYKVLAKKEGFRT